MTTIAGRITFGEIRGVSQFSFTRSRGIQPGIIQIVVPELPRMPSGVTSLFMADGLKSYTFRNCVVVNVDADYSDGSRYTITIHDYRWGWKFGQISGQYNIIRADTIIKTTIKKPRELAELCLDEMGVKIRDVSALPNDVYPEINWDLEIPAVALESLCSSFGCVVCPQLDGSVKICKQGEGKELPQIAGGQVNESYKFDPSPDELYISGAPTIWEVSLELAEAVGLEDDGTIVPIDKLLYKPEGGWGNEDPQAFPNVALDKRKLAFASVWKWFRFKFPFKIPELPYEITEVGQLFFEETLVAKETLLGIDTRKEKLVYGRFYDAKDTKSQNVEKFSHDYDTKTVTSKEIKKRLLFDGSFDIDQDKGIVKFSDACYMLNYSSKESTFEMPDVRVRVGVSIKDPKTHVRRREVYTVKTGRANGTKPMWLRKDEVRREIQVDPKTNTVKTGGLLKKKLDNVDIVREKLKVYAGFELSKLNAVTPKTGTYQGFAAIDLDGTIEQVTYSIGGDGFTETQASYGTEHSYHIPSFDERKRVAKLNAVLESDALTKSIADKSKDKGIKR